MFHGLTWFGIPIEYFLRFSELSFAVYIAFIIYGFFGAMSEDIKKWWRNR